VWTAKLLTLLRLISGESILDRTHIPLQEGSMSALCYNINVSLNSDRKKPSEQEAPTVSAAGASDLFVFSPPPHRLRYP